MRNRDVYIILVAILTINAVFFILSANQPFQGDEVVFPECAKQVIETGKPIINHSIYRPNFECLWHPPLYIYLLSANISIFGDNNYSIRAVQGFFSLLSIILVFFITKNIFKEKDFKDEASLLAAFLYALSPLLIQGSIVTDIDGGLLNFVTLLFLFFFVRNSSFYVLVPSLLLVFWSKFSSPVILFVGIMAYYIVNKEWKKSAKIISLFVITAILFMITFWIYSSSFDLDFFGPTGNVFSKERVSSNRFTYLGFVKSAWALKSFSYFVIPFFVLLFLLLSFYFYKDLISKKDWDKTERKLLIFNLISLSGIAMFTYLGASAWGFPKHFHAALAPMFIFTVGALFLKKKEILTFFENKRNIILIAILFVILAFYVLIFITDPLMPEFDATAKAADLGYAIVSILKTFTLYVLIPLIIASIVFYFVKGYSKTDKILILLLLLVIFFSIYINILHASTSHSSYYRYGDTGVLETVNYIKQNNIDSRQVATYGNIGYYFGMSNYYDIIFVYLDENTFKEKVIENNDIRYIIIFQRDIDRIGEDNMAKFKFTKQIGSYLIYEKV
ncbi:glycosyltransferase family 39 protein [Candidatus Pacearchaeota archaeon]|nr:MAG: hypothetical protein UW10_C0007G0004 [Candidatus Magasanikbacteria bacterium GW2011_GWA2_43_9]MBS3071718.1 glycosyltransferase family 39 protein [Candidatus Pacearchaeota archaeon]